MAQTKFKSSQASALQLQPPNHAGTRNVSWRACLQQLSVSLGKRTSVHGLNRLLDEQTTGKYQRLLWLLTLLSAGIGAFYICRLEARRYGEVNFETILHDSRVPVYILEFPAVTVCNLNHLNWARIGEAKKRFLPQVKSPEKLNLFERVIAAYDELRFANFDVFDVLQNESLNLMHNVNFSLVVDLMTWRCEELLTDCVWNHKHIDCCDIFVKRRTKSGLCWSFNTLESYEGRLMQRLDSMYPWRTSRAGRKSGLSFRALVHPELHHPNHTNEKGISVMVTELNVWHKDPFEIPEFTDTIIEVDPVLYYYDNDTRRIPSKLRECVFDDETESPNFKSLQGMVYMIENCESQCHQEYLLHYCNCTMDLMFPPGPYRSCNATDLLCLGANNEFFLYSHQPGEEAYVSNPFSDMVCPCFRNCYSMNCYADAYPFFVPPQQRGNISYVDVDVHFRSATMMVYRTRLVFDWVDLIVSLGSIVGLFLGCSIISVIEIIYFGIIELPKYLLTSWKAMRHNKIELRNI